MTSDGSPLPAACPIGSVLDDNVIRFEKLTHFIRSLEIFPPSGFVALFYLRLALLLCQPTYANIREINMQSPSLQLKQPHNRTKQTKPLTRLLPPSARATATSQP